MSAPQNPILNTQQIADLYTRENFLALQRWFTQNNQMVGFQFFEINETAAVTAKTYGHSLGLIPKDVVVSKITGPGILTWNYAAFTTTVLSYSTTGAVRVRGFIGTYPGDTSTLPQALTQGLASTPPGASSVVSVSASYVMTGAEAAVLMNATLPSQITLSTAMTSPVPIKNLTANALTLVAPQGSNGLIDGKSSFVLSTKNQSATVAYLAPNWYIVSNYTPGD